MINTKKITFSYEKSIEFSFPDILCNEGEALLVTGNSGVGKTTLLHLLGGLLRPKSGEIIIDNIAINFFSERKLDHFRGQNIGLILQQSYFVEAFTVLENVALASWLATGKQRFEKAKQLLLHLDLEKQLHKLPSQLSVGQHKQHPEFEREMLPRLRQRITALLASHTHR